jgi:hypothetical protein
MCVTSPPRKIISEPHPVQSKGACQVIKKPSFLFVSDLLVGMMAGFFSALRMTCLHQITKKRSRRLRRERTVANILAI